MTVSALTTSLIPVVANAPVPGAARPVPARTSAQDTLAALLLSVAGTGATPGEDHREQPQPQPRQEAGARHETNARQDLDLASGGDPELGTHTHINEYTAGAEVKGTRVDLLM